MLEVNSPHQTACFANAIHNYEGLISKKIDVQITLLNIKKPNITCIKTFGFRK